MPHIPLSEVTFLPQSFADPNGRLFWWKGELYRGITARAVELYQRLFTEGIVQRLVDKGLLIETERTSFVTDGYPMILRHRRLPFVSYPYEWCSIMLKDAALALIDLEIELEPYHLTLQDAHPWNIMFDGYKPIFVDFGSITLAKDTDSWTAADEFYRYFIYPLRLMALGYDRIARWLLHDIDQGVLSSDLDTLRYGIWGFRMLNVARQTLTAVKQHIPRLPRRLLKKALHLNNTDVMSLLRRQNRLSFLRNIRQEVEGIIVPLRNTEWSDYYENSFLPFELSSEWTAKHISVAQILDMVRPATVLDIGSNRGWFAQLAAQRGSQVVSFDKDETVVARLYEDVKNKRMYVLPLVMDFRAPSPGLDNQRVTSAVQRFRCDLVLALALVHHLVFKQMFNFDHIANLLSAFTRHWLLVEFIPSDDHYVREWRSEEYSWYTVENFITTLSQYFCNIKIYPSHPAPRVLLLCEK